MLGYLYFQAVIGQKPARRKLLGYNVVQTHLVGQVDQIYFRNLQFVCKIKRLLQREMRNVLFFS